MMCGVCYPDKGDRSVRKGVTFTTSATYVFPMVSGTKGHKLALTATQNC